MKYTLIFIITLFTLPNLQAIMHNPVFRYRQPIIQAVRSPNLFICNNIDETLRVTYSTTNKANAPSLEILDAREDRQDPMVIHGEGKELNINAVLMGDLVTIPVEDSVDGLSGYMGVVLPEIKFKTPAMKPVLFSSVFVQTAILNPDARSNQHRTTKQESSYIPMSCQATFVNR